MSSKKKKSGGKKLSKYEKVSIGLFERIADDDPQYLEKLRKKSDKWSNVACVFGVVTVIIEAVIFFFG